MHVTEDQLWDYADDLMSPEERAQLEALLVADPLLQEQLREVLAFKAQMHALPLEKPRTGFADAVLAAWATERMSAYQPPPNRDWMVFGVALTFTVFVLGAVVAALTRLPWPQGKVDLPFEMPSLELNVLDLNRLIPSGFSVPSLLPVVLVLMVFWVMNQYVQHRRFLQHLQSVSA